MNRNIVSKSNGIKRAANEKEDDLYTQRKKLVEMKKRL